MPKEDINGKFHDDNDGKFVSKGNKGEGKSFPQNTGYADILAADRNKKMTPAEKIASVHIDFTKDNYLPELNDEDLEKVGADTNKPVLLKKEVIDRNGWRHDDLTDSDFEKIIGRALYSPSEIFSANKEKPYFHFAKIIEDNSKGKPEYGLVILDVDGSKDNFEIVHAQFMRERSFNTLKKKK